MSGQVYRSETGANGQDQRLQLSYPAFTRFQRANTAFRAISLLRLAESFAARALPPLSPPSFPNATAAGFFPSLVVLLERLGMR